MFIKKVEILPLISFMMFMLLTACSQQKDVKQDPTKLTLQLKWVHQAQFAGFYVAEDLGFFEQQALDVEFLTGGPKKVPLEALVAGKADFAVTSAEDVVKAHSEGKPVVAIAAIYRLNPLIFMTLSDSGITDPRQFPGRNIAYSSQDGKLQSEAMMRNLSLDINSLKEGPYDYKYQNLLNGQIDITTGYLTGGYLRLKRSGVKVNVIWPEDYGVHVYGDVLATTENMLIEKPELVSRFLKASLDGWTIALQNQQQGVASTMKFALEADPELQASMLSQSFPLIETGEDRIGWMDASVWVSITESLASAGIIKKEMQNKSVFNLGPLKSAYEIAQ